MTTTPKEVPDRAEIFRTDSTGERVFSTRAFTDYYKNDGRNAYIGALATILGHNKESTDGDGHWVATRSQHIQAYKDADTPNAERRVNRVLKEG